MKNIISFDIHANMGFLKKPDVNESIYLTYNMLHKPALLGVLGAVMGYRGFEKNGVLPEYYSKLKDLAVSVEPLDDYHENGNFPKTVITYNNSVGYASHEAGGNLIIKEQTLITPSFRCYISLDLSNEDHNRLADNIFKINAEYIPYFGKNEYHLWWENPNKYIYKEFSFNSDFSIRTIFVKQFVAKDSIIKTVASFGSVNNGDKGKFMYFERLPISYNERLFQYDLAEFAFTNWLFRKNSNIQNLYSLEGVDGLIQLY